MGKQSSRRGAAKLLPSYSTGPSPQNGPSQPNNDAGVSNLAKLMAITFFPSPSPFSSGNRPCSIPRRPGPAIVIVCGVRRPEEEPAQGEQRQRDAQENADSDE
jgi:hypothetical protein